MSLRWAIVVVTILWSAVVSAPAASADTPVGPARYVPCPGATGDAARYAGPAAPYLCHSAVLDPAGNVVILRQGRSDAGPSAFGMLHALIDHNVSDEVVERVVSSAFPLRAPRQRVAIHRGVPERNRGPDAGVGGGRPDAVGRRPRLGAVRGGDGLLQAPSHREPGEQVSRLGQRHDLDRASC